MVLNIIDLPFDVLIHIFKMLSICDLHNLMLTCKALNIIIANDNTLWRWLFRHNTLILNRVDGGYSESPYPEYAYYFREHIRISNNWRRGIYRSKVLVQHKTKYMPWLIYSKEALLLTVGSDLHCYSVDKEGFPNKKPLWKQRVPTVQRHDLRTNDVSRFIWKENLLICGNRDGSTVVYDFKNVNKRPQIVCHLRNCHNDGSVEVSTVDILKDGQNTHIITASNDSQDVQFWRLNNNNNNLGKYKISKTVKNEDYKGIRCMALNKTRNLLALGPNGNNCPVILDLHTQKFQKYIKEKRNYNQIVRDLQWYDHNSVVYVNHSGALQIMDTRSMNVTYSTQDPFQSTLYCVKTDGCYAIVAGSSEYSRAVLFDRRKPNHVQMYFTQTNSSPVYCLDFNSSKLITAVDRGVTVLNFNIQDKTIQPKDYSHIFESCPNY